jgi:hypothetical protein
MRFDDGFADGQAHAAALRLGRKERVEDPPGGSPVPVSFTEIWIWPSSLACNLTVRTPPVSFIASMPFSMRFISTCWTCTRSALTVGGLRARPVRMETPCRVASARSISIVSPMTSFSASGSCFGSAFCRAIANGL